MTHLIWAAVIENRFKIFQIDVTQLVQPEVVYSRRGHREIVLLEAVL